MKMKMKFAMNIKYLIIITLTFFLITACDRPQPKDELKELLIYCGITMVKPITEIAKIIEKQENIKIHISQGGSKDLYNSLKQSQVGDLYLPGSSSYREKNLGDGLLKDYQLIGYNQASFMVKKGNPKQVIADINQLLRKDIAVALCNPESGSIGRETKKILTLNKIYDEAMANTAILNSDSRTLNNSLKNEDIDLIVNWRATAFFKDNSDKIAVLDLPDEMIKPKKLQLNLLSFSKHPEIAKRFMEFTASEEGQEIFRNHGFLDKKMKGN